MLEMIQLIARSGAFYYIFLKIDFQSSSGELNFFWWNLDFKYSLDAEMSLEEQETKRFKDCVV